MHYCCVIVATVLQYCCNIVAVCCGVLQGFRRLSEEFVRSAVQYFLTTRASLMCIIAALFLQCVAVCCGVLRCVAVCCGVLHLDDSEVFVRSAVQYCITTRDSLMHYCCVIVATLLQY